MQHSSRLADVVAFSFVRDRNALLFQVKVLELEQALQQERLRLGALRKKHYELAGVKEDESDEETNSTDANVILLIAYLFTKMPGPGESEGTFRSSSQAPSCLPHTLASHCPC